MTTAATPNYKSDIVPTWCPGCPNFLSFAAIQQALTSLNIPSHQLAIAYDIGCAGNMADFVKSYGIHTLHGRSIPVAMGIKLANPALTVCVIGGDGGIYGEGLNHLIAAARANSDIKVIVSNNYLYSLTTGQTSPTTPKGAKTKSTPQGSLSQPIDPEMLIKSVNPDAVVIKADARKPIELNQAVKQALTSPGFVLVDVSQTCVAFGKQLCG